MYQKYFAPGQTLKVDVSKRDDGADDFIITGRAIVFDEYQEAQDWYGDTFYERISSRALTLENTRDIHLLFNHDYNEVLGREGRNVTVELTSNGLDFEWRVPATDRAREIATLVRQGIIDGCSFGFYIKDETWSKVDETYYRTIDALDLLEITITPIPFYKSTFVRNNADLPKTREIEIADQPEEDNNNAPDEIEPEFRVILQKVSEQRAYELLALRYPEKAREELKEVYTNLF